jgi:hypothetical protein
VISYEDVRFDYDPYPIALCRPALSESDYQEMVESFPTYDELCSRESLGVKLALSTKVNNREYDRFVRRHEIWRRFHDYIQSREFIDQTLDMLDAQHVALGKEYRLRGWGRVSRLMSDLAHFGPIRHTPKITSRFEFSAMPVTGGCIRPHTDLPSKIVTLVIPIIGDEGWPQDLGGGTSVVWPKDRSKSFNAVNQMVDFEDVENVRTYAFEANQALIFVKTFNSWHAVWPMTGEDPRHLRQSLTINIEAF